MHTTAAPCAVLWDEAHLWGILLCRALSALQVPHVLLKAEHISAGALTELDPAMLLVPGGWARLKARALGPHGRAQLRAYVHAGGQYLGFCGGAGLGLASDSTCSFLDFCSWSRKPARERLPNFSGHLHCTLHSLNADSAELPVWWPSQFDPDPAAPLDVLARYSQPAADFWSADVHWSAVTADEIPAWEALYGINLNPALLRGEPCMIRGSFGRGSFILSYPHLETPDSPQANAVLARLLGCPLPAPSVPPWDLGHDAPTWPDDLLAEMAALLRGTIEFGIQHFLLHWRTPWLLGWRRGVPGSALNFLLAQTWQARHLPPPPAAQSYWHNHGPTCLERCRAFCAQARNYLLLERRILATEASSPEASASPELQQRKLALFGKFPGYGGEYGALLRVLDELLWLQSTPDAKF